MEWNQQVTLSEMELVKGLRNSEYFVLEACEYKRHFMAYRPDYAIMTNIDFDHPDYYTDIEDVQSAFEAFGKQVKKELSLVEMMKITYIRCDCTCYLLWCWRKQ